MTSWRSILTVWLVTPLCAGAAQFQVQVTPAAPSLSDTIRVDIRLTGTDGSDLTIDAVDIPSDCVRVQSASDQGLHQVVTLDPLKPGLCTIPPFRLRCLRGRTDTCDVRSAATVIPIRTIVADPEHAEIRDTEEAPLVPPEDAKKLPFLAIWLALAAAIVIAGLAFMRWRAWRDQPVVRARRRLRQLGRNEAGFSELVQVLREYLDERIGLGAHFCSSPELLTALETRSLSLGSTEQVLRDFLNTCDRSRFGRNVLPGTYRDALEDCDTLIECLDVDIGRRERAGI
ncbi:MAG TPA: hypothetical protein VN519_11075 [Bryobacteraceae bacterium]|nr:hypothetical protein [Bryobacteraceae bacterium]